MPKASEEANRLWPYLIKKVQGVARGGSGGSSGSAGVGGAPTPHALNSVHHTGVLSDTQGPQFLLVDGTRALTGNLAVNSGITIDGVDLSAHVGDPDAHHARATAGNTAIAVSGQAVSVALNATSGLSIASGLRVGAGDGIDVLTSTIAVDVTDIIDTLYGLTESSNNIRINKATDSGLAFNGSGQLTLGTPSNVSATSVNSLAGMGVSHSHAVTSSSDVGTTPPGVNRLLHATSTGGLILGTLTVKGNVDITTGGDLTVGSNVLFVDVSQESVGILRAPDPQFALDVNGPIRGTELVGKHAIQLEDLALLLHYDGGHPYNNNYTGEPNAIPLGQVPTTDTNIHYRPGKFYKAAVFGRSITNLITNPSFETNTTGWSVFNDSGGDLAVSRVSEDSWYGDYSAKLTWTTVNNSQFYNAPVASASAVNYSFGVWMRAAVPCSVSIRIQRDGSPFTNYGIKTVAVTEDWQWFTVTTTSSTPVAGAGIRVNILPLDNGANSLYVDGVQFEQTVDPTPYFDGSVIGSWTGTAHASTSTRTNSLMRYNLTDMVQHRWTLMAWVWFTKGATTATRGIMEIANGGANGVSIYQLSTGVFAQVTYGGSTTFPQINDGTGIEPGSWHHVAVAYSPGSLRVYLDGAQVASRAISFTAEMATLTIGLVGANYGNFMIDDVVVSRKALSADRIKAIYESDAMVFAESSVFHFRATPKGLVWADEEGLWMRDVDGESVMGFYGGAAASKSWGGATLEKGDILFGRYGASDGGWFWFDRDGVSSKPYLRLGYSDKTVFAFDSAGATIDGVLDISTNGGIYQGSGSFASPTTGLKIWNESGVGRIGGYTSGTVQWYANTDGKLYAGGGDVTIDSTGVHVAAMTGLSLIADVADGPDSRALRWRYSGNTIGGIYGQFASSFGASGLNDVTVAANADGAASDASVHLNTWTGIDKFAGITIYNPGTGDTQIDLDAQYVNLAGTASGAALGAYAGKLRVKINGVTGWIPYYSS